MSTKQPKPGVRTKLNSGKDKIKKYEGNVEKQSTPNPTAQTCKQNLPSMKLSNGNWVEDSNASILNLALPVSSERTLGENKVVPVKSALASDIRSGTADMNNSKKKKKRKTDSGSVIEKRISNKDKINSKGKNKSTVISDIKDVISKQVDSMKVDYEQLSKIQAELQSAANNVKSSIKSNAEKLNEYANIAIENNIKSAESKSKSQKSLDVAGDKLSASTNKKVKKAKPDKKSANVKAENIEDIRAAYEFAAESQAKESASVDPRLTQAIMKRNGAEKMLASLKAQLEYAAEGERRSSIEERIKQKETQLAEALKLIEDIENESKD